MNESKTRILWITILCVVFGTAKVSSDSYGRTVELWASTTPRSIFSNNYPSNYNSFSNCKWLIQSSNVSVSIKIEIEYIDIEYSSICRYDKLSIYDGNTVGAHVLANLCGKTKRIIVSSTSSVLLHFTSDWGIQGRGFHLRYSTVFGDEEQGNFLDKYQDVATIVGASIGGIVVACVFIYIVWLSCYTFYNKTTTTRTTNRCAPTPELYHTPASGDFCSYPVGPPSYEFAVPTSPPPPYEEVDPNPRPIRSFFNRLLEISMNVRRPRRHTRPRPVRPLSAVTHRNSTFGSRNASLFSNVRMTNTSPPSCIIVTEAEDGTVVGCLARESTRQARSPRRGAPNHSPTRSPTRRLSEAQVRRLSASPTRRRYRSSTNRANQSPTRRLNQSPRRRSNQSPTRRPNQSPTRRQSRTFIASPRNQVDEASIPLPTIHDTNNNSRELPTRQNREQTSTLQMASNSNPSMNNSNDIDNVPCVELPLSPILLTSQNGDGVNVVVPVLESVTDDDVIDSTDV